ncbi:MAG: hypothetical protein NBKEAIPA_03587 [Nitrospirae bacterium]|nr:MAG: hypothetical protein UZ03_NOB001001405 [Nitrospira sp. OLB3]MBV6471653.1 hypothetical protein [Nitrospirota bacterium]
MLERRQKNYHAQEYQSKRQPNRPSVQTERCGPPHIVDTSNAKPPSATAPQPDRRKCGTAGLQRYRHGAQEQVLHADHVGIHQQTQNGSQCEDQVESKPGGHRSIPYPEATHQPAGSSRIHQLSPS